VLNDLAVAIEAEDIDCCVFEIAGLDLVAVDDDEVSLCDRALELDSLAGILRRHSLEILDERLPALRDSMARRTASGTVDSVVHQSGSRCIQPPAQYGIS
jgi:hypothetical protein